MLTVNQAALEFDAQMNLFIAQSCFEAKLKLGLLAGDAAYEAEEDRLHKAMLKLDHVQCELHGRSFRSAFEDLNCWDPEELALQALEALDC